jgi:hypothetical protein
VTTPEQSDDELAPLTDRGDPAELLDHQAADARRRFRLDLDAKNLSFRSPSTFRKRFRRPGIASKARLA